MSIMLYVYSKIFCVLTSRQSRISRTEVRMNKFTFFFFLHIGEIVLSGKIWLQACERATDVETEYITSEIDSSYPQCSKDLVLNPPAQTTLYELLEYAKARSILKNSHPNNAGANHSGNHHESYVIRSLNTVQFNQSQHPSLNETSSIKSKKKIPIRISSLKRETKTAQTLR